MMQQMMMQQMGMELVGAIKIKDGLFLGDSYAAQVGEYRHL